MYIYIHIHVPENLENPIIWMPRSHKTHLALDSSNTKKTNNMVVFFTAAVQKLRKLHSTGLCQGLQRFGKSKFKTLTFIHHFVGQYPPKKHNNFQKNKMDYRENQGTYRFPRTTFKPQLTAKFHDRHHPILTAVWSQMVLIGKVHRLPEGVWMSNCLEH